MTALPDWMVRGLTVADYDALSEDICRQIEIVDGAILVTSSSSRSHQRVARHLANILEMASGPEYLVATDVDLLIRSSPQLRRRPDVVVHDSALPDTATLEPEHCLLVVEVMSPSSVTRDQLHKPAEYAAARIPHFWRVEFDSGSKLAIFRYRLDPTTRVYASAGTNSSKLIVSDPFDVSIDLETLL